MRHRVLLVPIILLSSLYAGLARAQEKASQPKAAAARPKLTAEQIDEMKPARYEVERVEIKYQPVITAYDGQELPQLCYDTRKEAEARVKEIKEEDRLDRLGVEGRQHKKVDIREDRRTHEETIYGGDLAKFAERLGVERKARYKPDGATTHCSEFVRDFARELLGRDVPELRGRAGDQADQLTKAAASPDSKWRSLSFHDDPAAAFRNAQELANEGKFVVVTWKNSTATPTDSGHVAVVVPSRKEGGGLFDSTRMKWGMEVPYIAQAGATVSDYMPLRDGFSPARKSGMEVYVLSP